MSSKFSPDKLKARLILSLNDIAGALLLLLPLLFVCEVNVANV